MNIQIYQTNAALGHGEYAYFIKIEQRQDRAEYLTIGHNFGYSCSSTLHDYYAVGEVEILEDYNVEKSDFKIEDSPLYGSFLFMEFLKSYRGD